MAAFLLFLLCTFSCCPATALQPAARFPVTIVSDLLYPLISNLVDPIVGYYWRYGKRFDRRHPAQAKREWIACGFGFVEHCVLSIVNILLRSAGDLPGPDTQNVRPGGLVHKRRKIRSWMKKAQPSTAKFWIIQSRRSCTPLSRECSLLHTR